MNKVIMFLLIISCLIFVPSGCAGTNKNDNPYKEQAYKGVSMRVTADSSKLTYTVKTRFDKIVLDGKILVYELVDGVWRQIPIKSESKTVSELLNISSPDRSFSESIEWASKFETNFDKGKYRLIVSFFTVNYNEKYYVFSEFSID